MDAVENYNASYEQSQTPIVNKLANALSSNMIIDYSQFEAELESGSKSITVTAKFIDADKVSLVNDTEFDFSAYSQYISQLSDSALRQIHKLINNEALYTKEYEIRITFNEDEDYLMQEAILNEEDLETIKNEYYKAAQSIYSDYISTSEMSTAFFCKSIKELSLDNIVDIYNANNEESQIEEDWQKELFTSYSKHYLNSMIINNIIMTNTSGTTSKGTITYDIEYGSSTIDTVLNNLLDIYYINKQLPVEKSQVIDDFVYELGFYSYSDTANLYTKSFDFTYSQNLNEYDLQDDFYKEIVNDIYEEFVKFNEIFDKYYKSIKDKYFFIERPFDNTTVISDNTGDSRYRQLDINVTGSTDCYIKLYSYNTVTDALGDIMMIAYVKHGESLQVFIPEGDYIFKYATGPTWYGDVYMFSDEGQYFAGSDVISVHEHMMTTTIELGNFDNGSIPAYSQTPDTF